jgi:hypothetical protein
MAPSNIKFRISYSFASAAPYEFWGCAIPSMYVHSGDQKRKAGGQARRYHDEQNGQK